MVQYKDVSIPPLLVHKEYIWYEAINSITAYEKENQSAAKVYYTIYRDPVSADPAWFEANKKSPEELKKTENVHGEFDFDGMYDQLDEVLAQMAM